MKWIVLTRNHQGPAAASTHTSTFDTRDEAVECIRGVAASLKGAILTVGNGFSDYEIRGISEYMGGKPIYGRVLFSFLVWRS